MQRRKEPPCITSAIAVSYGPHGDRMRLDPSNQFKWQHDLFRGITRRHMLRACTRLRNYGSQVKQNRNGEGSHCPVSNDCVKNLPKIRGALLRHDRIIIAREMRIQLLPARSALLQAPAALNDLG